MRWCEFISSYFQNRSNITKAILKTPIDKDFKSNGAEHDDEHNHSIHIKHGDDIDEEVGDGFVLLIEHKFISLILNLIWNFIMLQFWT